MINFYHSHSCTRLFLRYFFSFLDLWLSHHSNGLGFMTIIIIAQRKSREKNECRVTHAFNVSTRERKEIRIFHFIVLADAAILNYIDLVKLLARNIILNQVIILPHLLLDYIYIYTSTVCDNNYLHELRALFKWNLYAIVASIFSILFEWCNEFSGVIILRKKVAKFVSLILLRVWNMFFVEMFTVDCAYKFLRRWIFDKYSFIVLKTSVYLL